MNRIQLRGRVPALSKRDGKKVHFLSEKKMHFSGNLFFILFTFFFTFPALSMFWLDPFFDSFFVSSCFFPVRFLVRFWPLFFFPFLVWYWLPFRHLFGGFGGSLFWSPSGNFLCCFFLLSSCEFYNTFGQFLAIFGTVAHFWTLLWSLFDTYFSSFLAFFLVFFMTLFCSYVAPLLVPVSFCAPFSTFLERLGSSFLATCFLRLVWPKTAW